MRQGAVAAEFQGSHVVVGYNSHSVVKLGKPTYRRNWQIEEVGESQLYEVKITLPNSEHWE
jgi:hypothetical protein